jgi:hypothetical protein
VHTKKTTYSHYIHIFQVYIMNHTYTNLAKNRLEEKYCTNVFVQTIITIMCTYNVGDQLPIDVESRQWPMEHVNTNGIHNLVTKTKL